MRSERWKLTVAVAIFLVVIFSVCTRAGAPTIASLSVTSGAEGTPITIRGSGFGSSHETSTVRFNGTTAAVTRWTSNIIVISVPVGATTGNVVVTVSGIASNGVTFTVVAATSE